jgi:hypothetical protein
MDGGVPVNDIADDDQKLEKRASELVGKIQNSIRYISLNTIQCEEPIKIGPETAGTSLESVDPSVRAILVKIHGGGGAVRVFGDIIRNVVTGPKEPAGFVILVVRPGESCRLFGSPTVRYFRP